MQEKVLVIVPAYNEEKNIESVINELKQTVPEYDVLVVNDCSTDDTSRIAKSIPGIKVVDLPNNLGIGGAVQTGFIYADRNGYDYAVQVDGDGQHIPGEINKLFKVMRENNCDMVIGSRFLGTESFKTTRTRRMGIKLFYYIYRLLLNIKITDGTSGFRAYNKKSIHYLAQNYPEDYPEPEVIILMKMKGFSICETGVQMRERTHGKSSITPVKSVYYMIKVILSIIISYARMRW